MKQLEATIATTHPIDGGWQFGRADLEDLARTFDPAGPNTGIHLEHRTDLGTVGHIRKMWVEPIPGDDGHFALKARMEVLDELTDEEAATVAGRQSMSISFFFDGVSTAGFEEPDLLVGISPQLDPDYAAALEAIHEIVPGATVSVRGYREHSKEPVLQWLMVFGKWLIDQAGSNLFDLIWGMVVIALSRRGYKKDAPAKARPGTMKLAATTNHGEVHAHIPLDADEATVRDAAKRAADTIIDHHAGALGDGRIGVSFGEDGDVVVVED